MYVESLLNGSLSVTFMYAILFQVDKEAKATAVAAQQDKIETSVSIT